MTGINLGLTEDDRVALHEIAHTAIEYKIAGKKISAPEIDSEILKEHRGAFVSLHSHGNLRGCIGSIYATKPLYQIVSDMALAAAFQDPRFNPLTKKELKDLDIEISVLTPMKRIKDIQEIEIGKHGIYIVKQTAAGLLLPQVATEYCWDRGTFLEHTCTKAGLPKNAWMDRDTEIYIFSADIF
jgi:AmmeMemoRadiSam system protein A